MNEDNKEYTGEEIGRYIRGLSRPLVGEREEEERKDPRAPLFSITMEPIMKENAKLGNECELDSLYCNDSEKGEIDQEENDPDDFIPTPEVFDFQNYKGQYFFRQVEEISALKEQNILFHPKQVQIGPYPHPKKSDTKTLIINIESLIHICLSCNPEYEDLMYKTKVFRTMYCKRPYLDQFIWSMSEYYEIIIIGSLEKEVVDDLIDHILPLKENISFILTPDQCSLVGDKTLKQLRVIGDREKENIYIIDHEMSSWAFDLNQFIPIYPYSTDKYEKLWGPNKGGLKDLKQLLIELSIIKKHLSKRFVTYSRLMLNY